MKTFFSKTILEITIKLKMPRGQIRSFSGHQFRFIYIQTDHKAT